MRRWFWEFAGLGAPAFALLGLACALAPSPEESVRGKASPRPGQLGRMGAGKRLPGPRRVRGAVAELAGVVAAASLVAPWLSRLEVQNAASIWTHAPRAAYSRLQDAAGLNPFSDEAYLVAGSIALRYGDLALADRKFSQALARSPDDAYATLERGAIASSSGQQDAALRLLARAARLQPRDQLTRRALAVAHAGRRVSVAELSRSILYQAQQLR